MDREESPRWFEEWYFTGPYRLTIAGVVLSCLANALHPFDGWAILVRVVLLVSGVLLAAGAVAWGLRTFGSDTIGRSRAAVLVAVANLSVLASYLALHQEWQPMRSVVPILRSVTPGPVTQEWDSMRMVFVVLWWIGVAGAILAYLPAIGRKIVVSLAIVFHFGGITTAVLAVNVGGSPAPWIPTTLWNQVYRHYLTFAYLNNAYHFYSPEPGPPTLVWFHIEYEDGSRRWKKLVNRDDYPTRVQYQRMLAVTESVNRFSGDMPFQLQGVLLQRYQKGFEDDLKMAVNDIRPAIDQSQWYHQPHALTEHYLASYVRFVARTVKSEYKPASPVKHVRVYKLWHRILDPREMRAGLNPTDPTAFLVWYMGQYDRDGKPTFDAKKHHPQPLRYMTLENGEWVEKVRLPDPFLFWHLPIYHHGYSMPTAPFLSWYSKMHKDAEKNLRKPFIAEGSFLVEKAALGQGSPDPGNLTAFRGRNDETFLFDVTGTTNGSVWGSGPYTDDSNLAAAAVHAGALKAGERGLVAVKILPEMSSYVGSDNNGVVTNDYRKDTTYFPWFRRHYDRNLDELIHAGKMRINVDALEKHTGDDKVWRR